MSKNEARICIPSSHPNTPGHFPGMPVVAGAIILDHIIYAIEQAMPELVVNGFSKVKFSNSLKPDQACVLTWQPKQDSMIDFQLASKQTVIAYGKLTTKAQ